MSQDITRHRVTKIMALLINQSQMSNRSHARYYRHISTIKRLVASTAVAAAVVAGTLPLLSEGLPFLLSLVSAITAGISPNHLTTSF